MKRVLLIHPWRRQIASQTPHVGLALLAAKLRQAGHEVLVLDYLFLEQISGFRKPSVTEIAASFQPDVAGLSLYTVAMEEANRILNELSPLGIPVLVGGPHATLYTAELQQDSHIDYIFRGEAEESIVEVVNQACRQPTPVIIEASAPNPEQLPAPDFSVFVQHEQIRSYPLITSRGCPYACSFCSIRLISSRRWRPRQPAACIEELEQARALLPHLNTVEIIDDCPTVDLDRFKTFLHLFLDHHINLPLFVDNTRADRLDEETVRLIKATGATSLCIAVEHGNPEVFAGVHKQETHDDIRQAARLIREAGLNLYLCFIIGLPGDTLARTQDSIRFAKELKPSHIYWNMAHPFQGTEIRTWYETHGARLFDRSGYTSYIGEGFRLDEPVVETPDFSRWERKKANFLAVVETDQYRLRPGNIVPLLRGAWTYRAPLTVLRSLGRKAARLWSRKTR